MVRMTKRSVILSILLLISVNWGRQEGSQQNQPNIISAYGITLTRESSPREVASVLIKALDNNDEVMLTKLVAIKNEMEEFKKIYQRYGQRAKKITPEKVAITTAKGWIASYAIFEPGRTRIIGVKVEGEKAYVYCVGINSQGKERAFEIRMVREDGWWKVIAGLHPK